MSNNKKKIVFGITNNFFKEIICDITNELVNRNYEVIVLTNSNVVKKYFDKHSKKVKTINLVAVSKKYKYNKSKNISNNEIKKLYQKYSFDEETFFFRERLFFKRSLGDLRNYTIPILKYLDEFFDREKIDYVINCGEGLTNVLIWLNSNKRNINYFHTNWLGYIPGKHYWDSDIFRFTWIKKKDLSKKLTKQDLNEVKEFLSQSVRTKKIQGFKPIKIFNFYFVKKFIVYFYNQLMMGEGRIENNPIWILARDRLIRFLKKRYFKKYYKKLLKNEKFFYFPLHLHYDAAIALNNQEFYRQDKVIAKISKNLPEGYKLVVKEHPVLDGTMPKDMMKNIFNLNNVKIVSPQISSHDLIKNSVGVITICSSVGWEALHYKKPVIVLADTFYNYKNLVIKINDINSDSEIISSIKTIISNKHKINDTELNSLVYAFLKAHYDCNYFKAGSTMFDRSNKNVMKLTDSIGEEFKLRK